VTPWFDVGDDDAAPQPIPRDPPLPPGYVDPFADGDALDDAMASDDAADSEEAAREPT